MIWLTWSRPYFSRDVVDHLVAAIHAEVDVEVGHRHAFGIEEALEQQLEAQRVEIGDLQAPTPPASRRRSRGRVRPGCRALGPVDEVRDDQEVAGEAHLADHVQFAFQARFVIVAGVALPPARASARRSFQAFACQFADPAVQGVLFGNRKSRAGSRCRTIVRGCSAWPARPCFPALRANRRTVPPSSPAVFSLLLGRSNRAAGADRPARVALLDAHARLVCLEIVVHRGSARRCWRAPASRAATPVAVRGR